MKSILGFIITGLLFNFQSPAQISNEYFTITSSTSQQWAGGAAGSGSGTNYYFYITIKQDVKIDFDSVWITNGNSLSTGVSIVSTQSTDFSFKMNDNIALFAGDYYPGEYDNYNGTYEDKKGSLPPINYKGDALIRFYINDKPYYYAIDEIQNLAPIAYP